MTLPEWASKHGTCAGKCQLALVEHVLTQLGDPDSDYSELLDELCRSRWTEEVAS